MIEDDEDTTAVTKDAQAKAIRYGCPVPYRLWTVEEDGNLIVVTEWLAPNGTITTERQTLPTLAEAMASHRERWPAISQ